MSRFLVFDRIPSTREAINGQVQLMGNTVIESWKHTYERRPLDFTAGKKGYTADSAISPEEHKQRAVNRKKVFQMAGAALLVIVLLHPIFWVGMACFAAFPFVDWARIGTMVMGGLLVLNVIGLALVERRLHDYRQKLAYDPQRRF